MKKIILMLLVSLSGVAQVDVTVMKKAIVKDLSGVGDRPMVAGSDGRLKIGVGVSGNPFTADHTLAIQNNTNASATNYFATLLDLSNNISTFQSVLNASNEANFYSSFIFKKPDYSEYTIFSRNGFSALITGGNWGFNDAKVNLIDLNNTQLSTVIDFEKIRIRNNFGDFNDFYFPIRNTVNQNYKLVTEEQLTGLATDVNLANKVDKIVGKSLSTEDFLTTEKTKLATIEFGATANSTDAQLRDRSTHTGTQSQSTISGLVADLNSRELLSNKQTTLVASATKYPTVDAVNVGLNLKQDVLGFVPYNATNPNGYQTITQVQAIADAKVANDLIASTTIAPSKTAVNTALALKLTASNNLSDLTNVATAKTNLALNNVDNTTDLNKPVSTATNTALGLKVNSNPTITGATFPKITYDSKGLVTGGSALASTDIPNNSANTTGTASNVTGTVAVANGGTGATTNTGVLIGNFTGATTSVAGTASQFLRRNAGNTAYEFATIAGGGDAVIANGLQQFSNSSFVELNSNLPQIPPAVDRIKIISYNYSGIPAPSYMNSSGLITDFQNKWSSNNIVYWVASGNSASGSLSIGIPSIGIVGTATARNYATTNLATRKKRIGYVSAVTAGALAEQRFIIADHTAGSGSQDGSGFEYKCVFVPSNAATVPGERFFVGLTSSTATATNVEPSTLTNAVGVAQLSTDATQLYIVYGGTTAQTPIPLGVIFSPTGLSNTAYELSIICPQFSANTFLVTVRNLSTNSITNVNVLTGSAVVVPQSNTPLAHRIWKTNNTAALAVGFDICSVYFENR
jgi:hypothetical protein